MIHTLPYHLVRASKNKLQIAEVSALEGINEKAYLSAATGGLVQEARCALGHSDLSLVDHRIHLGCKYAFWSLQVA